MALPRGWDPEQVARYEQEGWRHYYDRRWGRALMAVLRLNRVSFDMSWPAALLAAVDAIRASRAFAPLDNDLAATRRHLEGFYRRARRRHPVPSDPATLAALELDYWVVHRELAIARKGDPGAGDPEPMIEALARLHAAIFDRPVGSMRRSAEARAAAAVAVDRITAGQSADVEEEWRRVRENLVRAYRALSEATEVIS